MNSDRKISVNLVSLTRLIGLILTLSLLLVLTACENGHYPRDWDKYYKDNFNQNFEAFQKLEQMQREDMQHGDINLGALGNDAFVSFKELKVDACSSYRYNDIEYKYCYVTYKNTGITNERWSEYKKLLAQANLNAFSYIWDEPKKRMVRFYTIYTTESNTGYVYMEYPPPKSSNSVYKCNKIMPSESCYTFLRKNWYVFGERYKLEQKDAK